MISSTQQSTKQREHRLKDQKSRNSKNANDLRRQKNLPRSSKRTWSSTSTYSYTGEILEDHIPLTEDHHEDYNNNGDGHNFPLQSENWDEVDMDSIVEHHLEEIRLSHDKSIAVNLMKDHFKTQDIIRRCQ